MTEEIKTSRALFVILGNQLFPFSCLRPYRRCRFFMAEDVGLCTYVRHHKQKIALFLAAMRSYRDELRRHGCTVHYETIDRRGEVDDAPDYESRLSACLTAETEQLVTWEIEDKFFESRMEAFAESRGLRLIRLPSPMFLTTRRAFAEWLQGHRPHMADFYRWQRRRLGILLDTDGGPEGGRWSFDEDNRLSLPADVDIPTTCPSPPTGHVRDVIEIVNGRFREHPGDLDADSWWLPTTRRQALAWLREFLANRFASFGPYEDALSTRDPVLFHSVLSPALNMGLITPREVIDRALQEAAGGNTPLNSVEGFIRQVIGWREFIRGIYRQYGARQETSNHFGHKRRLAESWYDGTTGMVPLDDMVRKLRRFGWAHHIERLMVAGNLMTLCEVDPRDAYRWFMEMFVDSSDWVMGPNVYGMATFADGGVFSTKPYICGSNYVFKMSDYRKHDAPLFEGGATWWDTLDGLYWRFVHRNRAFFRGQARMAQAVSTLDRLDPERRRRIFRAAESFISRATLAE